jgi:hypothetical protein
MRLCNATERTCQLPKNVALPTRAEVSRPISSPEQVTVALTSLFFEGQYGSLAKIRQREVSPTMHPELCDSGLAFLVK